MIKKVVVKNPGCEYCRYFLPRFEYHGKPTTEACTKKARIIVQQQPSKEGKRKWKWSDCAYAEEKNRDRRCADFQIQSAGLKLIRRLMLFIRRAEEQCPPTFSGEIWWDL